MVEGHETACFAISVNECGKCGKKNYFTFDLGEFSRDYFGFTCWNCKEDNVTNSQNTLDTYGFNCLEEMAEAMYMDFADGKEYAPPLP